MAHCWNRVAPHWRVRESPCVFPYLCVTVSRGVSQVCQQVSVEVRAWVLLCESACSWCGRASVTRVCFWNHNLYTQPHFVMQLTFGVGG